MSGSVQQPNCIGRNSHGSFSKQHPIQTTSLVCMIKNGLFWALKKEISTKKNRFENPKSTSVLSPCLLRRTRTFLLNLALRSTREKRVRIIPRNIGPFPIFRLSRVLSLWQSNPLSSSSHYHGSSAHILQYTPGFRRHIPEAEMALCVFFKNNLFGPAPPTL